MESGLFPVTSRSHAFAQCLASIGSTTRGVGSVIIDNDALYVSHSSTERGRVVASLTDAARWLEAIEDAVATPLAAA